MFWDRFRIIEKSEFRFESDCKVFGKCGVSCDLRHLNYLKQLEYNVNQSIIFCDQHQIDLDIKEVVACEIKSYRNKILLPIKDGNIGFIAK